MFSACLSVFCHLSSVICQGKGLLRLQRYGVAAADPCWRGWVAVFAVDMLLEKIVGETINFPEGGVVFIKGDRGNAAYLVRKGQVEIRESGRVLETMTRGEIFGEMALIDAEPRSASAVAVGATELSLIDKPMFLQLIREDPDFALAVMRLMSRRMRATLAAERASDERTTVPVAPRQRASRSSGAGG